MQQEVKLHNINMQIEAAAEYYVDYEFEQKIGKEKFLTFGDNYILIELSFIEAPKSLHEVIFKLQLEGYKIILAHPERYLYFTDKDYLNLVRRGVFFQLNTLSLIDLIIKIVPINDIKRIFRNKLFSFAVRLGLTIL